MPFTTLGLGSKITLALKEQGYVEPTPIQAKAIPLVLEGRDLIGVAQTGTGKTAAFVLPLLERLSASPSTRHMRALVVAPTRELVVQIEENVRAYGRHLSLHYATVFGGVGEGPQIQALRRGVDLVVATPGRLIDLMEQRFVNFADLQVLVLDEADRMLDMGFLPPIRRIVGAIPKTRQTLLFSATMSKEIEAVTREFLKAPALVEIGARSTPVEAVTQWVVEVSMAAKVPALVHLLKDAALESVLVFSRTKHGADRIARKLDDAGIKTATLHSNRTQGQRILALKRFKSGEVRCLVATDIAARGIDVDGISHVINYDFPPQPEDYVHRIGRTGRAQAIGDAISFVTHDDHDTLRKLERFLGRGIPRKTLEGLAANAPQPQRAAPAAGSWRPRGPGGPRRFGQRRGPQGRRGRT
ncbi:MAG: RNA helicase [Acidobacteria bacterium RIFCSPLOWO2_12_FULL_67_14b]|nr:MAG: RNA helicase [Acidobacteria bacterium RIFCSPLOWO2_12_FULL_67_14b]